MLVQIVSELLPQLCSNDSIQMLLKTAWFLTLGTKPIFSRGYAKRRNDYCCVSEYAILPLTQM